jgi:hypothetical protein
MEGGRGGPVGGDAEIGGASASGGASGSGGITDSRRAGNTSSVTSSGGGGGIDGGTEGLGGARSGDAAASGTGGTTRNGGSTTGSSGGAGTSGKGSGTINPDAGIADGGIVASGFCQGADSKITYKGQTIAASATSYQSSLVFDCCSAHGINLHTSASVGFDFQVEIISPVNLTPGDFTVGPGAYPWRAPVRISGEMPEASANNSSGQVRIISSPAASKAWELGLCLEVVDAASALLGTRIYIPTATVMPSGWNNRLQIYLLQDQTLRSIMLGSSLDSLVLAPQALLDLGRIAYVEQSTTRIGLNPGQKIGDALVTEIGPPFDSPFVMVADGVRIYRGAFIGGPYSGIPSGPYLYAEDIKADGFVIKPRPPSYGADPRNDERIIQVLKEAGKLVP